ncbi:MAG: lamin tail domain-containing protein [Prolixibacteraceae bacterium]|nr:lamin tail domain-containing protein [Prolixibacteraceae bacterium]
MLKTVFTLIFLSIVFALPAQVVINEASNRNYSQITDEDGEYHDWIELYNTSASDINLSGWTLSDNPDNMAKWEFGNATIPANGFLLIHASGKDRKVLGESQHWESAVLPSDVFAYKVPNSAIPSNWVTRGFNDASWQTGSAGFGYGDDDDETTVPSGTVSVYIRKKFNVPDKTAITGAILHVDYDDGFIAYLNGQIVARANINPNPDWNTFTNGNHEAAMYNGGSPEVFEIDQEELNSILVEGENILAIEVHNTSNTSSDLTLIPFLSFSLSEGKSYFQPIPGWFDGNSAAQLHTNFKLKTKGEELFLSKGAVVIDSIDVPKIFVDQSFGRVTNGARQTGIFIEATPGASNNTSSANTNGYTGKPTFSFEAGFYNASLSVSISTSEPNSIIRYTVNGSEPTAASTRYSVPVSISTTSTLKARCFSNNKLPGETTVATYLINEDFSLPVLSVSAKHDEIFGASGIFTNYNDTWDIPAYAEYFENDNSLAFSQDVGMQVDGGAGGSRSHPQHSFRIEPGNRSLGDGDLKYKLMHRRPNRDNYPSFYVRNGSNQYLTLPYKDGLEVTALGRNTYTYYSAYQPIVVFINGEYFGVYELREKINDDFLEDNYGMNIDSLDFLGVSYFKGQQLEALRGSIDPFIDDFNRFQDMNIHADNYLDEVDKFLDIKSYTDYIIAESWVANNDWPYNNIKLFRCQSTGYRWQWAINDLEWGLNPNGWTTSSFDHIEYMIEQGQWNYYTGYWYNMMQNPDYKAYFINRFADLMNTSYHFSVIGPLENQMFNEIYPEMDGEFEKWGNSNITAQMNSFTRNHDTFRSELERRGPQVRRHLQSHYGLSHQVTVTLDVEPVGAGSIKISTITPVHYPWEGIYFTDVPIEIEAIPNPGYVFAAWGNNTFIDDIANACQTGELTGTALNFTAYFDESANSYEGIAISEFNYKPGKGLDNPDWIELCNFGPAEVNIKDWYITDDNPEHVFIFSDDFIMAPGQRIIITDEKDKFRKNYPGVALYAKEMNFGLASPEDEINVYNKTGEPVASVRYSDHYPWALCNDDYGRTLELRTPGANPDQPSAWFRGCVGGSPGTAYQYCEEETVSSPPLLTTNFDLKVYPVPATNMINIDLRLDKNDLNCSIYLYDMMGKLVKTTQVEKVTAGLKTVKLPVENLREGIYFLRISTLGKDYTTKVLKVKN